MTTNAPSLVLASASPARLATLRRAGLHPHVVVSDVDEPAALAQEERERGRALSVQEQVSVLAQAKARAVADRLRDGGAGSPDGEAALDAGALGGVRLILGCDSLLEIDGEAHGKPWTADVARARWRRMRGRSGVLWTGHTLRDPAGREVTRASATTVHVASVTDAEIEAYLETQEPLAVAGAFTIDGFGAAFIERIEGDHHGVVGVSVPLLRRMTAELGVAWTDLWSLPRTG